MVENRNYDTLEKTEFLYLLILQGLLMTYVRWQFIGSSYALAFMFVFAFFKKKKILNVNI